MIDILKAYANDDSENVYKYRVKLLLQKGFKITTNGNEAVLDAKSNIGSALSMICSDDLPSGICSSKCGCGTKSIRLTCIEVDMGKLIEDGIENLNNCFLFDWQTTSSKCKTCRKSINKTMKYSSLVFVDLQPMVSGAVSYILPLISLNELPVSITLSDNKYNLKSVIEFQSGPDHYIAHCNLNGQFIEYNDLLDDVQQSKGAKMQPHMLLYVEDAA